MKDEDYSKPVRNAVKSLMDLQTMKEMITSLFERVGKINERLDIIEAAVTKNRLKEARKSLVKKLNIGKTWVKKKYQSVKEKRSKE